MTKPDSLHVFVDAKALDLPLGSTAIDAVRALSVDLAESVTAGTRIITDSRGLRTEAGTPMHGGAILRVIANRDRGGRGTEAD